MAGNEWINGYLEAILDVGATVPEEQRSMQPSPRERGGHAHFNPTRYFVEEVVTGVDETDLHRTWIKIHW
ncbi:putative sucrose-phosphate synthase 2 [Acorus calamus]|uniref:Sucrose-phosphate synthase 2 n=1 Tax=Acorus calamus TaxID=4465 RepID=A0AAV9CZD9_ACOCL|nr:putative sucrose-phosphate synthase 2 [Acorus calamus]